MTKPQLKRVCPLNDASFKPSKKCEALRTWQMNSQVAKVGTIETVLGKKISVCIENDRYEF